MPCRTLWQDEGRPPALRSVERRRVALPDPDLVPIELIALDRQRGNAFAHLVPDPLIAGVVNGAVETGEASFLAQILPVGCFLRKHVTDQYRDRAGNDRGVRDIGGMVRQRDEWRDGGVRHAWPQTPVEVFGIMGGDVGVPL